MSRDATYSQIHRRLVESGEWDNILAVLLEKLNGIGWMDQMKSHARENARQMTPLRFSDILEELDAHSRTPAANVPAGVRLEIMNMLRSFIDKQVET